MNRLTRDELITYALDEVDLATLDAHDRPAGVIIPNAHSIKWFQYGLDLFHNDIPWASRIATASINITTTGLVTVPTDFVLDILHGVVRTIDRQRMRRISYQRALTLLSNTPTATLPVAYTVMGRTIRFAPFPTATVAATLHYYAMPDILGPNEVPDFPSDQCLIEYIKLKALEWVRAVPTGTAYQYARERAADLKRSGLGNEPEFDDIQLDRDVFLPTGGDVDRLSWMGVR